MHYASQFEQPLPVCPANPVQELADMLLEGSWSNFCLCVDSWLSAEDMEESLDFFVEVLEGLEGEDRPLPESWVDLLYGEAHPYACLANCLDAEGYGEETEEDRIWIKSLLGK